MNVLITGFNPFGGEAINPSWEAVKMLPDEIAGAKIIKKLLPTEFIAGERELLSVIESASPSIIICTGQAAGRAAVSIERVAINLRDASIADNADFAPADEPVSPGGEAAYFVTLPVKALLAALKEAGIATELSLSAGSFVCNDILYTLLRHTQGTTAAAGFIHLPLCPAQAEKKSPPPPSMSIEDMAKALEIAVRDRAENNARIAKLRDAFVERVLMEIPFVYLNGGTEYRLPNNANLSFEYIEGESILINLDLAGIAVSSGSACSSGSLEPSQVILALGVKEELAHSSIRFSLGKDTTKEEMDYTFDVLKASVERLRQMSPLFNMEKGTGSYV